MYVVEKLNSMCQITDAVTWTTIHTKFEVRVVSEYDT